MLTLTAPSACSKTASSTRRLRCVVLGRGAALPGSRVTQLCAFSGTAQNKSMLPLECHVGRVQLVTPKMWDDVPAGSQQEPGTVAATAAKRPVVGK